MKLYLLRRKDYLSKDDNPWLYYSDGGFLYEIVIRAPSEKQARHIAQVHSGEESSNGLTPWLESRYTTCEELLQDGESGVILESTYEI